MSNSSRESTQQNYRVVASAESNPPFERTSSQQDNESSLRTGTRAEIVKFLIVGCLNWLVDFGAFNLFRVAFGAERVIVAKILSIVIATLFSWGVNRAWTFRQHATNNKVRELISFVIINALGMLPPLGCLWVSHHLLHLTSVLADNISANIVGLVLGTILRYIGYRGIVFTGDTVENTKKNKIS